MITKASKTKIEVGVRQAIEFLGRTSLDILRLVEFR